MAEKFAGWEKPKPRNRFFPHNLQEQLTDRNKEFVNL